MSRHDAAMDVFTAIADPTRRAILRNLGSGEQPVSALAAQFEVSLSAISQHIRILRDVGLVTVRKAGRERVYRLNPSALKPVADWVAFYEPFWQDKLDALETYLNQTSLQPAPMLAHASDSAAEVATATTAQATAKTGRTQTRAKRKGAA